MLDTAAMKELLAKMQRPGVKRAAVAHLRPRWACWNGGPIVGADRKMIPYRSVRAAETELHQRFRILNVVADVTRECLAAIPERGFRGGVAAVACCICANRRIDPKGSGSEWVKVQWQVTASINGLSSSQKQTVATYDGREPKRLDAALFLRAHFSQKLH